jgi:fused signal recognition particle receptor
MDLSAYYVEIATALGVLVTFLTLVGLWLRGRSAAHKLSPAKEVIAVPKNEAATSLTPGLSALELGEPPAEGVAPVETGLEQRLGKTRKSFWDRMGKFLKLTPGHALTDSEWDEIEEALLLADVGVQTSATLMGKVKERLKLESALGLRTLFTQESEQLFGGLPHGRLDLSKAHPLVISIVGVNGVGKTTTIGKLAALFASEGKKVLIGAGDTFRAAAITQLKTWSDRASSDFVTGREGGDPGAVAFDALTAAKARGMDVVLFDTAGRLHTKSNLMEELKRVHKVMKKVIPEAPHETWLVIDGTLGQNSVQQAREFTKMVDVTGVVVTKLDGTAKGGALFSIVNELKLPIRFIGLGEKAEDLVPFEPKPFVDAILNPKAAQ